MGGTAEGRGKVALERGRSGAVEPTVGCERGLGHCHAAARLNDSNGYERHNEHGNVDVGDAPVVAMNVSVC